MGFHGREVGRGKGIVNGEDFGKASWKEELRVGKQSTGSVVEVDDRREGRTVTVAGNSQVGASTRVSRRGRRG